jgi:hypothetical protein
MEAVPTYIQESETDPTIAMSETAEITTDVFEQG